MNLLKATIESSKNMNRYIFRIETQPNAEMHVAVVAETPSAAAKIVNQNLSEKDKLIYGTGSVGPDFLLADFVFQPQASVGEKVIVGEDELDGRDLEEARRFLEREGYNYQGDDENLAADEKPMFIKNLWTEDGSGVYAHQRVWASYDLNIEKFNFHIEAILYPNGRADFETNEISYAVYFKDKQFSITIANLSRALSHYEEKFMVLMKALQNADPD